MGVAAARVEDVHVRLVTGALRLLGSFCTIASAVCAEEERQRRTVLYHLQLVLVVRLAAGVAPLIGNFIAPYVNGHVACAIYGEGGSRFFVMAHRILLTSVRRRTGNGGAVGCSGRV